MRAFIAIDFSNGLKSRIAELQNKLRPEILAGRWKHIDNFHLTLKFLDEISSEQMENIKQQLNGLVKEHEGFSLNISKLGRFDGREGIRVLWLGLGGEQEKLLKLQKDIDKALSETGFPKEKREFRPHVTIGQEIIPGENFEKTLAGVGFDSYPEIKVDRVELFKSEQIGKKRVYTSIASFELVSGRKQ